MLVVSATVGQGGNCVLIGATRCRLVYIRLFLIGKTFTNSKEHKHTRVVEEYLLCLNKVGLALQID